MIALLIVILCTTSFSLIVRRSQLKGEDQLAVMGLNYVAASVFAFVTASAGPQSLYTWLVGVIGGCIYVTTYLLYIHSLELKGVAIANAITRLSVLIPVLGSIFIFGEQPHSVEIVGAVLAIAAIALLSLERSFNGERLTRRQIPLLLALFVMNGFCLFINKWFQATGEATERPAFLGVLYGIAAVASFLAWATGNRRLGWREIYSGVPLGLINFGAGFMLIKALDSLPGTIVFPISAAMGLVLTASLAAWLWQEIPGRMGRAGLAVAVLAVILINL